MHIYTKKFLFLGAILMALGVCFGAFGAHGLKSIVTPEMLTVFHTGVEYQFYHALGLFAVAFIVHLYEDKKLINIAGNLMFLGVMIFSFSLYLLVILDIRWLGAITPIGGTLMIISWSVLAYSIIKK
ncbi:MAG: DUF423 domain-containing protein [Candidatus Marinarcus sp.]|uniref:DUF423 domain-containing protein n=1 Tax=Candidatus Marinarcus sp. TaxID=3100987 RepID=UPI003B00251B